MKTTHKPLALLLALSLLVSLSLPVLAADATLPEMTAFEFYVEYTGTEHEFVSYIGDTIELPLKITVRKNPDAPDDAALPPFSVKGSPDLDIASVDSKELGQDETDSNVYTCKLTLELTKPTEPQAKLTVTPEIVFTDNKYAPIKCTPVELTLTVTPKFILHIGEKATDRNVDLYGVGDKREIAVWAELDPNTPSGINLPEDINLTFDTDGNVSVNFKTDVGTTSDIILSSSKRTLVIEAQNVCADTLTIKPVLKRGNVELTPFEGAKWEPLSVTVKEATARPPEFTMTLSPNSQIVSASEEFELDYSLEVAGSEMPETLTIQFNSSDPGSVEVGEHTATLDGGKITGKVKLKAVKATEAEVRITSRVVVNGTGYDPGGSYNSCIVRVGSITLTTSGDRHQLIVDGTLQLTQTVEGAAKNVSKWYWSMEGDTNAASVSDGGLVRGQQVGDVTIIRSGELNGHTFTARYQLSVVRNRAASIEASLPSTGSLSFAALLDNGTLYNACSGLTGYSLSYITGLFVSPAQGTLYMGYLSEADTGSGVATSDTFYTSGSNSLRNVSFVPKPDFTGDATIRYTGVAANGQNYTGEIVVKVTGRTGSAISYSVQVGESVTFQAEDFSTFCYSATGRSVNYVTFTPPPERYGTLYYNYTSPDVFESVVYANTRYYRVANPSLDRITFVPNPEYEGVVPISFVMMDSAGVPTSASLSISVMNPQGGTDNGIRYAVRSGERVYFDEYDFTELCYDETNYSLSYITLQSLPYSSVGTVYHGVNSYAYTWGTRYYVSNSTSLIQNLNFLANTNYEGEVKIPFTGYSTKGTSFTGEITIRVSKTGLLSYTVRAGQNVTLEEDDFNEASLNTTGYTLSYIQFQSVPQSYMGTLYAGSTAASPGTSYYYRSNAGGRLLRDLSFTASAYFLGDVTIPFTGRDVHGASFSGEVTITVTSAGSSISYTLKSGQRLKLDPEDFYSASYDETGYPLNYIRFTSTPSSAQGRLYANSYSSPVYIGNNYNYSGSYSLLKDVNFLSASGFAGSLEVTFTGYSTRGTSFTGTITFHVERAGAVQPIYYETTGPAVSLRPADFSAAVKDALSDDVTSVRLVAPDSASGKLYVDYTSPIYHSDFQNNHDYALLDTSRIAFVPAEGSSGTLYIAYTATDRSGNTCGGSIRVQSSVPTASRYFNDMLYASWAVQPVDFLRHYNILLGITTTEFMPFAETRRGDYVLMLSRAFNLPGASGTPYLDVPANVYYAPAIASAQALGILDEGDHFYPNDSITFQDACVYLYRCLKRENRVQTGYWSDLYQFTDRDQIAPYAIEAMASLVRSGVVIGDNVKRLNPTAPLTRAQMAMLLYRVVA